MKKIILFLIVIVAITLAIIFWSEEEFILSVNAQERMTTCIQGIEEKETCSDDIVFDDPPGLCHLLPPTSTPVVWKVDTWVGHELVIDGWIWDDCARKEAPYMWLTIDWGDGVNVNTDEYACKGELLEHFVLKHTYVSPPETSSFYIITLKALDTEPNETIIKWRCFISETPPPDGDDSDGNVGNLTIGPLDLDNPLDFDTFGELIDNIISFIFTLSIILAPILLVVAGIMFLFAGGDPAKVQKAKKLILYTIIGFTIIALSKLFVELIQGVFGVKES